ncbi:hypothetical protein Avbf_05082, partial [Armadillidium vulgare]
MKTEPGTQQTTEQTVDGQAAQIITANGQTYSVLPQAQMQTVTFDGQEAIYIQTPIQHQVGGQQTIQLTTAGGQTLLAHPGQIIRTPNVIQGVQAVGSTNQHQTLTVSGVRQATANAAQTNAATANQVPQAQVVQLGMHQASIPVQIPISTAGGQTIFQTIPFPVQIMPNVVQANGQTLQVIPQLTQQQQMTSQPQIAQILMPNGQIQQVQMVTAGGGMVSLGTAGTGATALTPIVSSQNVTTSTWTTSGNVTSPSAILPHTQGAATTSTTHSEEKQLQSQQHQQQQQQQQQSSQVSIGY